MSSPALPQRREVQPAPECRLEFVAHPSGSIAHRRAGRRSWSFLFLGCVVMFPLVATAGETVLVGRSRLADASMALQFGDAERGIRLIEEQLAEGISHRADAAKALSNLCAGYILMRDYDAALVHCNHSLEIDDTNWRAFNNRASALLGQGRLEDAIADLSRGLDLWPDSAMMRRSLENAYERKRLDPGDF